MLWNWENHLDKCIFPPIMFSLVNRKRRNSSIDAHQCIFETVFAKVRQEVRRFCRKGIRCSADSAAPLARKIGMSVRSPDIPVAIPTRRIGSLRNLPRRASEWGIGRSQEKLRKLV
jgi:hypothetical protein